MVLGALLGNCHSKQDKGPHATASASASARVPVDRLSPGELKAGSENAFGLPLPEGMKVVGRFSGTIHAAGNLRSSDVSNYLRTHVRVTHVELEAGDTVFPNARIIGGNPNRVYRIDVVTASPTRTTLKIENVTPPKAVQGIGNTERLKRVGLKPNGELLDPAKLE